IRYNIGAVSTGPNLTYNAAGVPAGPYRIENRFAICARSGNTVTCPDATRAGRVQQLITAGALASTGITAVTTGAVSVSPTNPFLLLDVVRARNFQLNTGGEFVNTDVESFYLQDDFKVTRNVQL